MGASARREAHRSAELRARCSVSLCVCVVHLFAARSSLPKVSETRGAADAASADLRSAAAHASQARRPHTAFITVALSLQRAEKQPPSRSRLSDPKPIRIRILASPRLSLPPLPSMLSFVVGLLMGAGATVALLLYLLLKFDPTPALQSALLQRRVDKRIAFATSLDTPPTPWELTQQQMLTAATEFESCAWINSIAAYAFTFLSEKINAAAADGRLEAFINSRLARKRMPDFVCAPVVVLQLSVGRSLPVLHSIKVTQTDPERPMVRCESSRGTVALLVLSSPHL